MKCSVIITLIRILFMDDYFIQIIFMKCKMTCIKILSILCSGILLIALILSYFHISVVTNYLYKYGNLYTYSSMASYKSDKARRLYKRQYRVKEQFGDRTLLMRYVNLRHVQVSIVHPCQIMVLRTANF